MAIFDDVVVNAKSAAAAVSKKAGTLYDLSKLRISLSSLRADISKKYQALGEAVYNNDPEDEIAQLRAEIDLVKQNIEDVEKVLNSVKNSVTCPNCGEKLSKNAQFCIICGKKIPSSKKTCENCGTEIVKDAQYCYVCGKPVSKADNED